MDEGDVDGLSDIVSEVHGVHGPLVGGENFGIDSTGGEVGGGVAGRRDAYLIVVGRIFRILRGYPPREHRHVIRREVAGNSDGRSHEVVVGLQSFNLVIIKR